MKLEFANTDKKINSTEIVSTYPLSLTGAKFKEECNLTFPVFMIGTNSISYTNYNYVKVTFDNNQIKYYFINSFELGTNNCWYIKCTMDVLATFRSSILAKSLYVLRSASDYNADIIDTLYPATTNYKHSHIIGGGMHSQVYVSCYGSSDYINKSTYFMGNPSAGGYFYLRTLGYSGGGTASLPGTTLYIMDYYGFSNFILNMFRIDYSGDFSGLQQGVARSMANVTQYIVECFWMPVGDPGLDMDTTTDVKLGPYSMSIAHCVKRNSPQTIEVKMIVDVPEHHPQGSRGNFLDASPYTKRTLVFYPFGVYDISAPESSHMEDEVSIDISVDEGTGQAILNVTNNEVLGVNENTENATKTKRYVFVRDVKDYKVTVPITEYTLSLFGAVGQVLQGASAPATKEDIKYMKGKEWLTDTALEGKLIGQQIIQNTGIGKMLEYAGSGVNSVGTLNSFMAFKMAPDITCDFCYIADEDKDHNGRPLCQVKLLSTLSGYTLCKDDDIGITGASQDQLNMIKDFLTGGFFIE